MYFRKHDNIQLTTEVQYVNLHYPLTKWGTITTGWLLPNAQKWKPKFTFCGGGSGGGLSGLRLRMTFPSVSDSPPEMQNAFWNLDHIRTKISRPIILKIIILLIIWCCSPYLLSSSCGSTGLSRRLMADPLSVSLICCFCPESWKCRDFIWIWAILLTTKIELSLLIFFLPTGAWE